MGGQFALGIHALEVQFGLDSGELISVLTEIHHRRLFDVSGHLHRQHGVGAVEAARNVVWGHSEHRSQPVEQFGPGRNSTRKQLAIDGDHRYQSVVHQYFPVSIQDPTSGSGHDDLAQQVLRCLHLQLLTLHQLQIS